MEHCWGMQRKDVAHVECIVREVEKDYLAFRNSYESSIRNSKQNSNLGHMFMPSRYSAMTATALLVLPCWPPSGQWPMTIAVLLACNVMAPWPLFFAYTTFLSSSRRNRYEVPSARMPPPFINAVKSPLLKQRAIFALSCPCSYQTKITAS